MSALDDIRDQFDTDVAACVTSADVEALKVRYLGRKGLLAQVRANVDFKSLDPEERASFGKAFNDIKTFMESSIEDKAKGHAASAGKASKPLIDSRASSERAIAICASLLSWRRPKTTFSMVFKCGNRA